MDLLNYTGEILVWISKRALFKIRFVLYDLLLQQCTNSTKITMFDKTRCQSITLNPTRVPNMLKDHLIFFKFKVVLQEHILSTIYG